MTVSSRRAAPALALSLLAPVFGPAAIAQDAPRIEHVITYGQSHSTGVLAQPVISSVQRHDSLMFAGGVRTPDSDGAPAGIYGSLQPLVETDDGAVQGETPTAGTLEQIVDLRWDEDGASYVDDGVQYLGSAPGQGGFTILQLSRKTAPLYRVAENIVYGSQRAAELGAGYRVGAMTWTHGEADYKAGTARSAYAGEMETMRSAVDWLVTTFTGASYAVPLLSAQVSSHLAYGRLYPAIALAQADAAAAQPHIYLVTPLYHLPHASDGLHLTAESSKWLGAYFGLAYKRVVDDGLDWQPLRPLGATASGRVITVRFNVPAPPLVLDTTAVSNPGNFGFSVANSRGQDQGIAAVEIAGPDSVRITMTKPAMAGWYVRYAFKGGTVPGPQSGPRGNLRDSQGDGIVFDPAGLAKPLHNWCIISDIVVTRG